VARLTRKWKIALGMAAGCLVLPVLAFLALNWYLTSSGTLIRSDYPAVDYDPLLTREAARALPLIKAIDRYRGEHASLPAEMADLGPYLPAHAKRPKNWVPSPQDMRPEWEYTRTGAASYDLFLKLDWDPSLNYRREGSKGYWYFDPGDGSDAIKIIKLNP
jgi:hypothetical protein